MLTLMALLSPGLLGCSLAPSPGAWRGEGGGGSVLPWLFGIFLLWALTRLHPSCHRVSLMPLPRGPVGWHHLCIYCV